MEVFHYMADVVEIKPLFESIWNETTILNTGAIYNNYNYSTEDSLTSTTYDDLFPFTSTERISKRITDKEFAILEVDGTHGVLY